MYSSVNIRVYIITTVPCAYVGINEASNVTEQLRVEVDKVSLPIYLYMYTHVSYSNMSYRVGSLCLICLAPNSKNTLMYTAHNTRTVYTIYTFRSKVAWSCSISRSTSSTKTPSPQPRRAGWGRMGVVAEASVSGFHCRSLPHLTRQRLRLILVRRV